MPETNEYYLTKFSKGPWKSRDNKRPHPGLALYRFFEKNKKEAALKRLESLNPDRSGIDAALKRQKEQLNSLQNQGYAICAWQQTSAARLVCGLGEPSLAENGLFMDRIWGLPYIPGSALKGIAQDQALMELSDFSDAKERRDTKRHNQEFVACFGSQSAEEKEKLDAYWMSRQGHVIFLDAFPILGTQGPFELDIINPHYQEYYSTAGQKPPADYLSPIPNLFLTLGPSIAFSFALAAREADFCFQNPKGDKFQVKIERNNLCKLATAWLQKALSDLGVGGKTRVGYGYFHEEVKSSLLTE